MKNNKDIFGRPTFFDGLTPLANAIRKLPKGDELSRELFAKDDDARIAAAKEKRARKCAKRAAQLLAEVTK